MSAKQDDAGVLFPDVDVEVRDPDTGEPAVVAVREFRLLDGLRAQVRARELVVALAALAIADPNESGVEDAASFEAAVGAHAEDWLALLALATGRDAAWLARLSDADGRSLNDAMWEANGPFFVRRIAAAAQAAQGANLLRSLGSFRTSSTPATDATSGKSPDDSPGGRPSSPGDTPANDGGTSRATS